MDIAGLDAIDTTTLANAGIKVPLKRLDGEPLLNALNDPVGLILHGTDSEQYRRASRRLARIRLERAQKAAAAKEANVVVSDEEMDRSLAEEADVIVACTSGWYGILDSKKKLVEFTPEGATFIYSTYPIAREQAESAIGTRALFTKASSGA